MNELTSHFENIHCFYKSFNKMKYLPLYKNIESIYSQMENFPKIKNIYRHTCKIVDPRTNSGNYVCFAIERCICFLYFKA